MQIAKAKNEEGASFEKPRKKVQKVKRAGKRAKKQASSSKKKKLKMQYQLAKAELVVLRARVKLLQNRERGSSSGDDSSEDDSGSNSASE